MKFSDLLERVVVINYDNVQGVSHSWYGMPAMSTNDFVYIQSVSDVCKLCNKYSGMGKLQNNYINVFPEYPTDYAILCGAKQWNVSDGIVPSPVDIILRNPSEDMGGDGKCVCINSGQSLISAEYWALPELSNYSYKPVCHLNIDKVKQVLAKNKKLMPINRVKNGNRVYHTIDFGEFPQTYVGGQAQKQLSLTSLLQETKEEYVGYWNYVTKCIEKNPVFINKDTGEKFVKTKSLFQKGYSVLNDGTKEVDEEYLFCKVEPIRWIIVNWEHLPKDINPEGDGLANTIECVTEKAIISGLPFQPLSKGGKFNSYYQNSLIRAYLNGYESTLSENLKRNGNSRYNTPEDVKLDGIEGFIEESMSKEIFPMAQNTTEKIKDYVSKNKSRIEKLNPDTTSVDNRREMTDTEMIKSWINNGESVLLRGPSGIGKTERIRREYGDRCIYLKLTNNMFPEKVVGSVNLQTGQEVPPNYAKEAILACATPEERKQVLDNIQNIYDIADNIYERSKESDEKIVILLDELLNVKPAVQSLVYTLVLNRFVENGKGLKLPKNVVVVATGNQKKYSSVAEDLAEPLEKRFDHILDMEPKVNEWLFEYAIPNSLHPSVINYISSKQMESKKTDISYFYEEPEVAEKKLDKNGCKGKTNDPRGWSSISQMLYNFERDLQTGKFIGKDVESYLKKSLQTKLRDEWAEEFFDFYNNPTISLEDVMNDAYVKEDLPVTINEKFATISGLLGADMTEIKKVREFISKHCSPEHREVFDVTWSFGNVDRMQKLVELKEEERLKEERERLFKEKENEKLLSSQNIPINRFLELNGRVGIKCDAFWKLNTLCKALNKMGKTWANGESYLDGIEEVWDMYKTKTCIDNIGLFDSTEVFDKENIKYVDFDLIDFSGVFTKDEIMNYKNRGTQTGIKLTEFCETSDILRIHCDDLWKAKKFCKAMHRMKKKLGDGTSYVDNVNAKWKSYENRTCYGNNGLLSDVTFNPENIPTYDFGEVDFTGALTDEEIANIKENLKRAEKGM